MESRCRLEGSALSLWSLLVIIFSIFLHTQEPPNSRRGGLPERLRGGAGGSGPWWAERSLCAAGEDRVSALHTGLAPRALQKKGRFASSHLFVPSDQAPAPGWSQVQHQQGWRERALPLPLPSPRPLPSLGLVPRPLAPLPARCTAKRCPCCHSARLRPFCEASLLTRRAMYL